jgi:hypothetical protein
VPALNVRPVSVAALNALIDPIEQVIVDAFKLIVLVLAPDI